MSLELYEISKENGESEVDKKVREYSTVIGSATWSRGKIGDRNLRVIDRIPLCTKERCGLYGTDQCKKSTNEVSKREICFRIHDWIKEVQREVYNRYLSLESNLDFLNIGVILIPMYIQLFVIQKELDSMEMQPLVNQGTGSSKINPLFEQYVKLEKAIQEYEDRLDTKILKPKQKKEPSQRFGSASAYAERMK